ncbi:MAG: ATP-binding cassette domain-containing protein [Kiritimatiellae bacterium]|jgi:peptide/nickel transport system ATP-binding protein|nr:ATP-binding cassette domain-containing protein [Kiritimatiellia bacterium]
MKNETLKIEDLRVYFPVKQGLFAKTVNYVKAVDGLSLTLKKNQTLGVVGESGCGKSTLARAIMLLEKSHTGKIIYNDQNLLKISSGQLKKIRKNIQMVFQDPFSSLNPGMTILDLVTEAAIFHKLIKKENKVSYAESLLENVGLSKKILHRYPHEFSGGQRQRISIARALSANPEVIICDEAVSALDVSVQAQVINLLADLREKHQLSYIFISHDISVIAHISDYIAVMYAGQIVEQGPKDTIINFPIHPYTQALISAVPSIENDIKDRITLNGEVPSPTNPPSGCRFHTRCQYAEESCKTNVPSLKEVAEGHLVACPIKAGISQL